MIKNKISPIYFQHDLLNTEMPAAFFDPTAKTPMYFYHLNNESEIDADNLFIDEDNNVQHTFEMTFYGTVDCWFATNISKFVQPFHSDSLAKTMAYQTELKCYIDDIKIFDKIKNNFCIFTFEPLDFGGLNSKNKLIAKYVVKEINEFKDRLKLRYAEVKLLQLNSNLIKSAQRWTFNTSLNLNKRKIKQIKLTLPFESAIGTLSIIGREINNGMIGKEDELDWKISRVISPFEKLEPICLNYVKNDDKLLVQAVSWDQLGKAFEWLSNWSSGPTMKYHWSWVHEKEVKASGGAAGYSYFINSCVGIADFYCGGDNREKANDVHNSLKAYFWTTTNINAHINIWHCFYVGKTMNNFTNYNTLKNLFTNTNNVYQANWKGGYGGHDVGDRFSNFSLTTLGPDNFQTSTGLKNLDEIKEPTWVLAGNIELKQIFNLDQDYDGRQGYLKLFKPDQKLPWGLLNKDQWKKKIAKSKINNGFDDIQITINLPNYEQDGVYLTKLSLVILFADYINIQLIDELNQRLDYTFDTNFYAIDESEIQTIIRFN